MKNNILIITLGITIFILFLLCTFLGIQYTNNRKQLNNSNTLTAENKIANNTINKENLKSTVKGIVIKPYENGGVFIVRINGNSAGSMISVSSPKQKSETLKLGQEILIYFDGSIAESYPEQIHNVGKIEILKEKTDIEIPTSALRYSYSSYNNVSIAIKDFSKTGLTMEITDTNKYPYEYSKNYVVMKKNKEAENNNPNTTIVPLWEEVEKISNASSEETVVITTDKDENKTTITCNWGNMYDELSEGEYTFQLLPVDSFFSIKISFNIEENGKLSYKEPSVGI